MKTGMARYTSLTITTADYSALSLQSGTGNVISQEQSRRRQNSTDYIVETSIASITETDPSELASPNGSISPGIAGGSQLKYLGRGGAGNFVSTPWENSGSGDMEMQRTRESEVKEKVAADVEKGLSKPDRIHDPYR